MLRSLVDDLLQRLIEQPRQQVRLSPQLLQAMVFLTAERVGIAVSLFQGRVQLLQSKAIAEFPLLSG